VVKQPDPRIYGLSSSLSATNLLTDAWLMYCSIGVSQKDDADTEELARMLTGWRGSNN